MTICRSKEALRASRVALVQLLAALGILESDIGLERLEVEGAEGAVEEVFPPRSVRRRGDPLLVLLKLDEHQNGCSSQLPLGAMVCAMSVRVASRAGVDKSVGPR